MALVFRRGELEEEPREMLEKEEKTCDIIGKNEIGEGGEIVHDDTTASGGDAKMPSELSCPCSISGPVQGVWLPLATSDLMNPEDSSAELDLQTSE